MAKSRNFRELVCDLIARIPYGRVITYGDIAALCGSPNSARIVGGIAHYGDYNLPWHRLVNRFGGLASGFPGGREVQEQLLLKEGVRCINFVVNDFEVIRWKP